MRKLTGKRTRVKFASRTDAGVHAKGQVASFSVDEALPLKSYTDGLNHYLPDDIAVRESLAADSSFDPRRDAVSREYRYSIVNSPVRSPLRSRSSHRVYGQLDVPAMNQACQALVGKHDLASFVTSTETVKEKRTVRNIYKAEITRDADMILFDITADSFLPHQVRNMVGSLLRVGRGRMKFAEFYTMIEARTPGLARETAPAKGLCLMRVNYPGPLGSYTS